MKRYAKLSAKVLSTVGVLSKEMLAELVPATSLGLSMPL